MLNTKIGLNRVDGEGTNNRVASGLNGGGFGLFEGPPSPSPSPNLMRNRSTSVQHQTIPETTTSNHSSSFYYHQYYQQFHPPASPSFTYQHPHVQKHFTFNTEAIDDYQESRNNKSNNYYDDRQWERKYSISSETNGQSSPPSGEIDINDIPGPSKIQTNESSNSNNNNNNCNNNNTSNEGTATSRCLALEQAYVHDVYSSIAHECGACSPVRSHIKEFLYDEFEFGSLVMDVGCGDGKYLNLKSDIFTLGMEKCPDWFNKENMVNTTVNNSPNMSDLMVADVIYLPVRDEFFDGVLCCGVLHHISTTDRRVSAIKEMCRVIKIGGKLLITVWAFEGRELESQDVLIKWNSSSKRNRDRYGNSGGGDQSSDESTSSCSTSSTTTTNYVNRKAAYESCNSPTSQFGTCYSFVRKALQRFSLSSNTFYHSPRRASKSSTNRDTTSTSGFATLEDMPIELRNIEEKKSADPFGSGSPEMVNNVHGGGGSGTSGSHGGDPSTGPSKGFPLLGQRAGSLFHLSHNHNHPINGPLSASASVSIPGNPVTHGSTNSLLTSTPTTIKTNLNVNTNDGPSTAPVSRQNSLTSIIGGKVTTRRHSLFNMIRNSITKPIRKTVGKGSKSKESSPINSTTASPQHRPVKNKLTKGSSSSTTTTSSSTGVKLNGFLSQHRFSLPANLRGSSNHKSSPSKANNQFSKAKSTSINNNNNNCGNNGKHKMDSLSLDDPRGHLLSSQESTEASYEFNADTQKDSIDHSATDGSKSASGLAGCSLDESIVASVGDNDGDDEEEDAGPSEGDGKRPETIEEGDDMLMMIRTSVTATIAGGNSKRKREAWGKILQKSLSSDSLESKQSKQSRQQSTGTEAGTITTTTTNTATTTTTNTASGTSNSASTSESSSKLVAYYSMPELRLLMAGDEDEDNFDECGLRNIVNRNKPRLSEIHPITFLNSMGTGRRESKGSVIRNDSQDTQNALEDTFDHSILELATISCTSSGSGGKGDEPQPPPPLVPSSVPAVYPPSMIPVTLINKSSFEESSPNSRPPSSTSLKERLQLNLPSSSARSPSECSSTEGYYYDKMDKDGKTVRSLSVEYKPAICSSYRQGLRRFSASPSLLVSKPFFQLAPHTSGHETHPSVDSEESFVTIIPAGRSCRTGSGTIEASLGDEVDSFMDDVILDIDATSLGSTEEDEALCEQLTRPFVTVDTVGILGRASVHRTSSLGPSSPRLLNSSGTNSIANLSSSGVSPCPPLHVTPSSSAVCSSSGQADVSATPRASSGGGTAGGGESDDLASISTATTKSIPSLESSLKGREEEDEVDADCIEEEDGIIIDNDHSDEIKSNGSTPSPPANLHRYFHLFKCGELEEVIEQNVENLHVVKSYYSEHANSWCVVAEKVRVWTI